MTRSVIRLALILLLTAAVIHTDPVALGILRARVEGPREQSMPRDLTVRVRPSLQLLGQENLSWENVVSCPVRAGEWMCRVPAGRVDLRITGTAIQPIYRWGVSLQPGETEDLGTLRLWRGGSISGSVRPEGKIPQYSVRVDLLSLRGGPPGPRLVSVEEQTPLPVRTATLESTSRPWGFFRFDGLPPGPYVIRVTDPGLPVLRSSQIDFTGDRAVELPPLLLNRITFSLQITPPKDPYGKPWAVGLIASPQLPYERPPDLKPSSAEGRVSFTGLPPGDYKLVIASGEEPQKNAAWFWQDLHLDGSTSIKVHVPCVRVAGKVLYRDRGLKSTVTFRDSPRSFRYRYELRTNEFGEFGGYVREREEDSWIVGVNASDPPMVVELQDPVKVPKGAATKLEIRVPDTFLTAEVADVRGRLSRAAIQALGETRNVVYQENYQASPFIGLKPGRQRLRPFQRDPDWGGDPVEVELAEGKKAKHLRLLLPKTIEVRGKVLPRLAWPAGVRVFAWPSDSFGGVGFETGQDGTFQFVLRDTRTVQLVVLPPGNALRMLQAPVSKDKLLEIPLRRPGGTLVIEGPGALVEVPEDKEGEPPKRPLPVLLRQWADLQGTPQSPGRLVVPNVEPGAYTLCPGSPFTLRPGQAKEGEKGCASGVLKAAGELALRIPASSPAALPASRAAEASDGER